LKLLPLESLVTITYSPSLVISEMKRCIGRKSRFFIPLAFDAPVRASPSEYCHTVWYGKTRMVWLPDREKSLMIFLAVLVEYRRVTDGQTDGHLAPAQFSLRVASRGKN